MEKQNFYVLTGGSGTGKSTLIDTLKTRGYFCVEEVGRQIVREQIATGGDATPWQNQIKLRDLIFKKSLEAFMNSLNKTEPVFFDRGFPETIGYSRLLNASIPAEHQEAIKNYRYNTFVFVTPPWQEIYVTDAERKYTFEQAVADYHSSVNSYTECGYSLIEVPKVPVNERVDFILHQISSIQTVPSAS